MVDLLIVFIVILVFACAMLLWENIHLNKDVERLRRIIENGYS
jgi:hypothetical protein